MNTKRLIIATVAVFVYVFAFEFVYHGVLLKGAYMETMSLWRPQEECNMMLAILSQVGFSLILSFIFTRHYEAKGIGEGMRFGLYIGALFAVVTLATYVYMPIPLNIVLAWMGADLLKCLGSGLVLSVTYKN